MEELLKALAEAVRTGKDLALPALIGYYITRILAEAVVYVACWWIVLSGLYRIVALVLRALILNNYGEGESTKKLEFFDRYLP